jgi:S-adenosylmethionine:tRNA ribosyltransferase-isomerase
MSELDQYDYSLPRELIAQEPCAHRADARLLIVSRKQNSLTHWHVRDLPEILRPGDCLVLNDTRVIPARLVGFRDTTGGKWEGLFLEHSPDGLWLLLCKCRGRLTEGEKITLVDAEGRADTTLRLVMRQPDGAWVARPASEEETLPLLERIGRIPLPRYIRKGEMLPQDRNSYQTVFARTPGAVAAPTAGLHFTPQLLQRLEGAGIRLCRVTLHVGAGTFRPITATVLAEHKMHSEWGQIGEEAVQQIQSCRGRGGRIVAVGTTVVRLLETAAQPGSLRPFTGRTELFIHPPYQFRAVDVLMTNFHLPRTTLLILVRTFGGEELIKRAYEEAIREEYRFYSYGDAMLVL